MKINHYTRDELIRGIRERDSRAVKYIYATYWSPIERYVVEMGGTWEEAEDIFQESMIVLVKYVRDESFKLSVKFRVLLFGIARNILLKKQRENQRHVPIESAFEIENGDPSVEDLHDFKVLSGIIREQVDQIRELCRKLLEMFLRECTNEEIASALGLSITRVYKRKKLCKDELIDSIMLHPEFIRIKRVEKNIVKGEHLHG